MKGLLKTLTVLAVLTAGIVASAQPYGEWHSKWRQKNQSPYSLRMGWGGAPEVIGQRFQDGDFSFGYVDYMPDNRISTMYADYMGDVYSTGLISGELILNLGRVFNLSTIFGLTPMWAKAYNGQTGIGTGNEFGVAFTLVPQLKLMYCNSPTVRVYSSGGIGVGFYPGFREADSVMPELEIVPLGIEIGRRWYGFGEIGIGTLFMGGQVGVGYRFNGRRNWR